MATKDMSFSVPVLRPAVHVPERAAADWLDDLKVRDGHAALLVLLALLFAELRQVKEGLCSRVRPMRTRVLPWQCVCETRVLVEPAR